MSIPTSRAALPLLVSVAAVVLSTGFTATLLPLAVGDTGAAAGIASSHFAGFLVGAPVAGRVIRAVGAARAALLFALIIALTTTGLAAGDGMAVWMTLRFVAGIAVSGYFVLVESRLNDLADAASRGRLMAAYLMAFYAAQAAGSSMAGLAGPDGTAWLLATLPLPLLGALPPDDRALLTLQYLEGWDLATIAQHFGWTVTATKLRAWRARCRLHDHLTQLGYP